MASVRARLAPPSHTSPRTFSPVTRPHPQTASFVYILRVAPAGVAEYPNEDFTAVRADDIESISLLKARACEQLGWGTPSSVTLFLVPGGRIKALGIQSAIQNPTQSGFQSGASLVADILVDLNRLAADVAIVAGSWLLARVPPPAAAPGACRRRRTLIPACPHLHIPPPHYLCPPPPLSWC